MSPASSLEPLPIGIGIWFSIKDTPTGQIARNVVSASKRPELGKTRGEIMHAPVYARRGKRYWARLRSGREFVGAAGGPTPQPNGPSTGTGFLAGKLIRDTNKARHIGSSSMKSVFLEPERFQSLAAGNTVLETVKHPAGNSKTLFSANPASSPDLVKRSKTKRANDV